MVRRQRGGGLMPDTPDPNDPAPDHGPTGQDGPDAGGLEPDHDQRLRSVEQGIKVALDQRAEQDRLRAAREANVQANRGASVAWRLMFNLVLATVLGAAVGHGVDRATGFGPLGLLVGLLAGFALGIWGAARTAAALQKAAPPPAGDGAGP